VPVVVVAAGLVVMLCVGPAVTPALAAYRAATPTTTVPATTPPVAPIPGGAATPSTVPLATRQPSAHVSAVFSILSIAGFLLVLLMLGVQWILTRPGRRRGWTL
jgi:hypothetical protein